MMGAILGAIAVAIVLLELMVPGLFRTMVRQDRRLARQTAEARRRLVQRLMRRKS